MSTRLFAEVDQHTVPQLKKQGFKSVQFVLLDRGVAYQATVELKPLRNGEGELDTISLHSKEIYDYLDGLSIMTRYLISEEYLAVDLDGH